MRIRPRWITPLVALAAQAALAEPERVPVACTVSHRAGAIATGEDDVTALVCQAREGFFVPGVLYRDLTVAETKVPHLEAEVATLEREVVELRIAGVKWSESSSASKRRAQLAEERVEELEDWTHDPILWTAVGVALAIGSAVVYSLIDGRGASAQ